MSTVITVPVGKATVQSINYATALALDGTTRITNTSNSVSLTAANLISLTAPTVNVGTSTFTTANASMPSVTIGGTTTMSSVAATTVAATSVTANTFTSLNPSDTLTVTANTIEMFGNLNVTGAVDATTTTTLLIENNEIDLGVNADGSAPTNDTTQSGAGLVIAGVPDNLPTGVDPTLYKHSLTWNLNTGNFYPDGTVTAPQVQPTWEFCGGAVGIVSPDAQNRPATFFFAPYFTSTQATLGLYYSVAGNVAMVQNFSTPLL